MGVSEAELLADLKAHKAEAVSSVVEAHSEVLLRGALGLGLPLVEAEDLVQDVFTVFLSAVSRFEGRSSVRTFLFGILYRKSMERARKRSRELATDPTDAVFEQRFSANGMWASPPRGPEDETLQAESGEMINSCLEGLTEAQRAAFYLREVERQSAEAICNILDVKSTHLRVLLFRARLRLRECIENKWDTRS
jgi:RNA polymerase sigma-70 factor (ECF subfamily)